MNRNKLFISNLPGHITGLQLQAHMGAANAYVIGDGHNENSRGFGFADFNTKEERDARLKDKDGSTLGGRQINVHLPRKQTKLR